ncbi:Uncharacterised protein [Vibrio cholerae]|nr:Uncharacterised protein [Vibrio cholerae]
MSISGVATARSADLPSWLPKLIWCSSIKFSNKYCDSGVALATCCSKSALPYLRT